MPLPIFSVIKVLNRYVPMSNLSLAHTAANPLICLNYILPHLIQCEHALISAVRGKRACSRSDFLKLNMLLVIRVGDRNVPLGDALRICD